MNKNISLASLLSLVVLLTACSPSENVNRERASRESSLVAAPAPTVIAERGFVYTANERGNSISAIDVSTGQVINIATHITPHNVQVSRDGRLLLAVGPLAEITSNQSPMKLTDADKMERGRLLMIDTGTLAVGSADDIEIGRHPAHVIIDAQGKRAGNLHRQC